MKKKKMWQFYRYGVNKTCHKWHYCQNCMHSAEEVLNEIDTDECILGIVGVDNFTISKKDHTRINLAMERTFGKKVL